MELEEFDQHPAEKKANVKSKMNSGNRQLKFRSKPVPLTKKEIKTMLAEENFFDSKLYRDGRGFKNDFEEQEDDQREDGRVYHRVHGHGGATQHA